MMIVNTNNTHNFIINEITDIDTDTDTDTDTNTDTNICHIHSSVSNEILSMDNLPDIPIFSCELLNSQEKWTKINQIPSLNNHSRNNHSKNPQRRKIQRTSSNYIENINNIVNLMLKTNNKIISYEDLRKCTYLSDTFDKNKLLNHVNQMLNMHNDKLSKKIEDILKNFYPIISKNEGIVTSKSCNYAIYVFRKIDTDLNQCELVTINICSEMKYSTFIDLLFKNGFVKSFNPIYKKKTSYIKQLNSIPSCDGYYIESVDYTIQFS